MPALQRDNRSKKKDNVIKSDKKPFYDTLFVNSVISHGAVLVEKYAKMIPSSWTNSIKTLCFVLMSKATIMAFANACRGIETLFLSSFFFVVADSEKNDCSVFS